MKGLDWDNEEDKCYCKTHPCHVDHGLRHDCDDLEFPLLKYREEENEDGSVKTVCECVKALSPPPVEQEL
jgi:hypothetical protein